jgi:hypothetical protein
MNMSDMANHLVCLLVAIYADAPSVAWKARMSADTLASVTVNQVWTDFCYDPIEPLRFEDVVRWYAWPGNGAATATALRLALGAEQDRRPAQVWPEQPLFYYWPPSTPIPAPGNWHEKCISSPGNSCLAPSQLHEEDGLNSDDAYVTRSSVYQENDWHLHQGFDSDEWSQQSTEVTEGEADGDGRASTGGSTSTNGMPTSESPTCSIPVLTATSTPRESEDLPADAENHPFHLVNVGDSDDVEVTVRNTFFHFVVCDDAGPLGSCAVDYSTVKSASNRAVSAPPDILRFDRDNLTGLRAVAANQS